MFANELMTGRLERLRELLPNATEVALAVNPNSPAAESDLSVAQQQVRSYR